MSRNTMAGLSAFLIVAGIAGLLETTGLIAAFASAFALLVGLIGAKHAVGQ